jgi:hypothetical protein
MIRLSREIRSRTLAHDVSSDVCFMDA